MEKIIVDKTELLEKVKQNRTDHRAIFEEALEGFKRSVEEELSRLLAEARAGKRQDIRVVKTCPKDHTGDYDRTIAMIEMAKGDEVTLAEHDFAMYVMDDWGWQAEFLGNTYGSSTARGKFSDSYAVR